MAKGVSGRCKGENASVEWTRLVSQHKKLTKVKKDEAETEWITGEDQDD